MSQDVSTPIQCEFENHLARIDPLQDQPAWMAGAVSEIEAPTQTVSEVPVCLICDGARWIKEAVSFGHPHFGVLFPCSCLQAEWACHTAVELAHLSNLDAMRGKTFASLNPF